MVSVTKKKCSGADRYSAKRAPMCGCLQCATAWAKEGGMLTTLPEYWDQLRAHDWFYSYSDDGSAYSRGKSEQDRLERLSKHSERFGALWHQFQENMRPGGEVAMPERPRS